MQGLLAAVFVSGLAAGCSFHAPDTSTPGGDDAATADASIDAPPAARCVGYNDSYGGHQYRLNETGRTWDQSKASCDSGGYLLKIETSGEDVAVVNAFFFGPQEVWMGLRDVNGLGAYVWTDGMSPTFTNWNGGAPSASSSDCVVKNTYATDGHWYTKDCTSSRAVICECEP